MIVNFTEFIESMKRQWRIIVISTLLFITLGVVITIFFQHTKYEAEIKVYIGKENFLATGQDYNNDEVVMYQRLIKTYAEIAKVKEVVNAGIKTAKADVGVKEVLNSLTVTPMADTQILQLKYIGKDKQESYDLLYGIAKKFIDKSKELYPKGNVKVIQQVDVKTKSPNLFLNVAIAFLLGILVGSLMVYVIEFLDNTFKSKEGLEREINIAVLGVIPVEL